MQFHYNINIGFQIVEDSLLQVPIKNQILATGGLTRIKFFLIYAGLKGPAFSLAYYA